MIAADWALSNVFYYFLNNAAVNLIAPVSILVLALFWSLWHAKSLNGAFIHRTFFSYYALYFLINLWHLLGRFFFPETLTANYVFSLAASNGVFILILVTLWLFAILKFLDRHAEGGLMGVYERNIGKWRKWFGGR
ncbi:hypothetical protein [Hyphococcus luteus]|uniref:Uncharacterized protein n=1 Tax=Hyphococcus luteus TaxID=2058213 RepID=A0A2S7K6E3_9PROT|nr:hypothetical protein [Marinicaulis flavus]PQA88028.1 hypothetical protein CW354_06760 [Marinicaulis flavus]